MRTVEEINKIDRIKEANMEHFGFGPKAMKKQKVCLECGTVASSDQSFCKKCGHRLPLYTLYQTYRQMHRICSCCDTVLAETMQYCPKCGSYITQKEEAVVCS